MDIKDWILIGGALVLAAVIGHGFWLAWRSRDRLKMDIDPNIPRDPIDPLHELRGELPNGGARVVPPAPEQGAMDFGAERSKREPIVARAATRPLRDPKTRPIVPERPRGRTRPAAERMRPATARVEAAIETTPAPPKPAASKQTLTREVIVINVLARNGVQFEGTALMEAFLRNGLKFGEMNIFHRIEPASKIVQFSVASAVEPGTFDLSAMEVFRTPGVSFFMQMPGPDEPLDVFEDMLAVTRDVAAALGADLKDEHQCVMTSQTIAHCRARIEDFSRKRMSQRA